MRFERAPVRDLGVRLKCRHDREEWRVSLSCGGRERLGLAEGFDRGALDAVDLAAEGNAKATSALRQTHAFSQHCNA